jgi:hypothetical protein
MKLYHDNATGCAWNGESYKPDETGAFDVPEEAVLDLLSHGFTTDPGTEPEAAPVKATGRKTKAAKATDPGTEPPVTE